MIVRKLLVSDGRTERELLLVGTIVVGRDPSCQLNDLDPFLSRRHAEFVPTGRGVTVRDLKSRNGILVNGEKMPEHALKPGDVVQLGHLHVRYVEERVVKSAEDHSRVRAKTEIGIEVPTMAPLAKPASAPVANANVSNDSYEITVAPAISNAASAPAPIAPTPADDDADATVAPARHAETAPRPTMPPHRDDTDRDETVASAANRGTADAPTPGAATSRDQDADATRVPWSKGVAAVVDPDATVATRDPSLDETRAAVPATASARPGRATDARVVANAALVITEASPSCQTVIGARPDTIVGGQLADAISRSLRFVATGDGPSALSVSIVRASSGGTITVTFKAGQATENHS